MMKIDLPKNSPAKIKIFGVGGGGSNAVGYMFKHGLKDVDFIVCNTDQKALNLSAVPTKILLGAKLSEGRGTASLPRIGKAAAEESTQIIKDILSNHTEMVFIVAGLGGGTGTGGGPVIARVAKSIGVLTVGIFTLPFSFEGENRFAQAKNGLKEFKKNVDLFVVFSNDMLQQVYGNLRLHEAFAKSDKLLAGVVKGFVKILDPKLQVGLKAAEAETIMRDSGGAIVVTARAKGKERALNAAIDLMRSPYLENVNLNNAKCLMVNVSCGEDEITMDELGGIIDYIKNSVGENVKLIHVYGIEDGLTNEVEITLIAIGLQSKIKRKTTWRNIKNALASIDDFEKTLSSINLKKSEAENLQSEARNRIERLKTLSQQLKTQGSLHEFEKKVAYNKPNLNLEKSNLKKKLDDSVYAIYVDNKRVAETSTKSHALALSEIKKLEKTVLDRIDLANEKIHHCHAEIEELKVENNKLKELAYADSSAFGSIVKIQTIPTDIYIDTEDSTVIYGVYEAVIKFLESVNFERAFEFVAIKGSWFKRMVAKSKDALSSDAVIDRLKEAEYGVEVNAILKQQSEIDKNQSEALLNILKSVENVPNAAIRIGSLLVVKLTNNTGEVNVQVRSLSIKELHLLNKRPDLLHRPQQILNALTSALNGD